MGEAGGVVGEERLQRAVVDRFRVARTDKLRQQRSITPILHIASFRVHVLSLRIVERARYRPPITQVILRSKKSGLRAPPTHAIAPEFDRLTAAAAKERAERQRAGE